ncbi:MAG: hypothetical protein E7490_08585 [Ruminococcaceae bacterium]|nr:hypothetical protein [Oscillospiraceae bacterium]
MKKDIHKFITIGLFSLISVIIPIITLINCFSNTGKVFSENENRYLKDFPEFSFDNIIDKEFTPDFEEYFSDRIFLRENWIGIKNNFDKLLGKKEIKGVFTENGRMIEAWKTYDKESVEKNLAAMNQFAEKNPDINMYFMLAPTAQGVYEDTLPENCGIASQKAFIKLCYENTPAITGIDVFTDLYASRDNYIYYRTDHHWTSLASYYAYNAASKIMKYTPYALDKFSVEHASNSFKGTLYSKTLDNGITPDTIDYYTLSNGDPSVIVKVNNGMEIKDYGSMYFRSYLEKKDKYSSFLGANVPVLNIKSNISAEADNGSLLVIKDSYAHSLVPFLTKNYSNITVVDLRYINGTFEDVGVNLEDYNSVLFMYNVITFSQDMNVKKLSFM